MGITQGATPATAALNRVSPVNIGGGSSFTIVMRIRWASAPELAAPGWLFTCFRAAATVGLTLTWNGTSAFSITVPFSITDASQTLGIAAPAAGTMYDLAVVYDATLGTMYGYWRATAAGSAGLTAAPMTSGGTTLGAGTAAALTRDWYWFNDEAKLGGLSATILDAAIFNVVLPASDIELFGKGAAPMQLLTPGLQQSPADIGGTVRDRLDGAAMTVSGTAASAGVTDFDGPRWDTESASQPVEVSGSIMARYDARVCVKDSSGNIRELPDLSGGGAHQFMNTDAVRPVLGLVDGLPTVTINSGLTGGLVQRLVTRTGGGTGAGRVAASGGPISQAIIGGSMLIYADPAWTMLLATLASTAGAVQWAPSWDTSRRLGLFINGGLNSVADSMLVPTNRSFMMFCHDGTGGANNVYRRVDEQSDQYTQGNSNSTRYMDSIGYVDSNTACAWMFNEIYVWTADKRTAVTSNVIASYLRSRWAMQAKDRGLAILGTSTEAGNTALAGGFYIRNFGSLVNAKTQVANFSRGGVTICSTRLTVNTSGGGANALAFVPGELITQATSAATGKFLCESNGEVYVFDQTGTFNGANQISGATAIRNVTAFVGNAPNALANTVQVSPMIAWFTANAAIHTRRAVMLNTASNAIAAGANPAAEADAFIAFVVRLRTLLPTGTKIGARMHQPRTSGGANHTTYRDLLRDKYSQQLFDFFFDCSTDTAFDDYTGTTDYNNVTYYSGDSIHMNNTGHLRMGALGQRTLESSGAMGLTATAERMLRLDKRLPRMERM